MCAPAATSKPTNPTPYTQQMEELQKDSKSRLTDRSKGSKRTEELMRIERMDKHVKKDLPVLTERLRKRLVEWERSGACRLGVSVLCACGRVLCWVYVCVCVCLIHPSVPETLMTTTLFLCFTRQNSVPHIIPYATQTHSGGGEREALPLRGRELPAAHGRGGGGLGAVSRSADNIICLFIYS